MLRVICLQTTELNKQLTAQLAGVRGEHQTLLDQLKEAHSLLDKHIESSNRAQDSEVNHSYCIVFKMQDKNTSPHIWEKEYFTHT